jgi:hypothetical protein
MAGALLQLVAYGAQDLYITGQPQITFFKVVYRRYTNFAMESIEQTFNGTVGLGRRVTVTISRSGDLLGQILLQLSVTAGATATILGFETIDNIELEIGGQVIDRHYGEWMAIWCALTYPTDKYSLLCDLLRPRGHFDNAGAQNTVYVPLQFWFCNNPGLTLPLIALQYHEVKLNITFKTLVPTVQHTAAQVTAANAMATEITGMRVWCDYVFLDTDERRRFAQMSHEYLIEQVQTANPITLRRPAGAVNAYAPNVSLQTELYMNHPTKCLIWVARTVGADNVASVLSARSVQQGDTLVDEGGNVANINTRKQCVDALLQFNGTDRFKRREGSYFTQYQRYKHFGGYDTSNSVQITGAHIYSFALKPGEHQPSGTCNFSRIDSAVLLTTWRGTYSNGGALTDNVLIYGVNYNILRIVSGMGGVAYSN